MSPEKNKGNKAIFLFGPTAVGKTRLLSDFFSAIGEVVNADSVQVYKGLDIGSAKAGKDETDRIPHHLIDILEPWETYNVADFIHLADIACHDIWQRGKIPVISGGTAYYFKHFLYGLSEAPQSDPGIRQDVALFIRDQGLQKAHDYLKIVDPVSADRINPNDSYRISRAIEVYRSCGKPLSSFALPTNPRNDMQVLSIGLTRERQELKNRIRERVDIMFAQGLVGEIRGLLENGANPSWQSMQGIGYSEFMERVYTDDRQNAIRNLDNLSQKELDEIKQKIVSDSVHYAKRQMTFFRSFSDVVWIDPDNCPQMEQLISDFLANG